MIIYTQTPDYYQEYLEHGWLKDQAAKVHKYLERWRGKNGKWYYRYTNAAKNAGYKLKSKMTDAYVRFNRKRLKQNPEDITRDMGLFVGFGADNGRATSRSGKVGYTKNGISAGRKRAAKRAEEQKKEREWQNYHSIDADRRRGEDRTSQLKSKGYKQGNLSKKGYSNSTSGENSNVVKNSSVVKKVNSNTRNSKNKKSLNNQGYHDSKNTYNSKGDSLYNLLTGDNGWPVMFDPTAEGGTRRYKSRTEVWRNLSLPEQYYILYKDNPKKFEQVATPQIREEINKELRKRNKKTI